MKAPDAKCLECHGGITDQQVLSPANGQGSGPAVVRVHAQHMHSGKVRFTCLTCHQGIDPFQGSAAGLRDQVSPNMCFKCHFPHGEEARTQGPQ